MRLSTLFLLAACSPAATVDGATDTGAEDTGAATDLSFAITGDLTGATFSLSWIDASTFGSQSLTLGEVVASAPAEATQELALDDPPESQLIELDPDGQPGTVAAFYLPALHYDADGDGAAANGEVVVGAGRWWAYFIGGTLSEEAASMGLELGWNSANLLDGDPAQYGGASDIPLAANQVPVSDISVSGTAAEDLVGSNFAVLSAMAFSNATPPAPLFEGELAATWSVSLSGAPGEDHVFDIDGKGTMGVFEVLAAYSDTDASGDYSTGDQVTGVACHDQRLAALAWVPPPTDVLSALGSYATPGWNVMGVVDGTPPEPLTAEEAGELRFGPECAREDEPQ